LGAEATADLIRGLSDEFAVDNKLLPAFFHTERVFQHTAKQQTTVNPSKSAGLLTAARGKKNPSNSVKTLLFALVRWGGKCSSLNASLCTSSNDLFIYWLVNGLNLHCLESATELPRAATNRRTLPPGKKKKKRNVKLKDHFTSQQE